MFQHAPASHNVRHANTIPSLRITARRLLLAGLALMILIGSGLPNGITSSPVPSVHAQTGWPAPTLLSPPNYTTTTADNYPPLGIPELRWDPVPGATSYRIQFSQSIGFPEPIPLQATTTNTRYTPTQANILSDGTWYWRVRVESPSPPGDYSSIWSFEKQWASPTNQPILTAPDDGATLAFYDAPDFSWQPVMGAAAYRFQIANSPDGFNDLAYKQNTLAPTHQPALKLDNGTYYWRVVPVSPADRDGTPSEVRTLHVSYDAPTLLEPADGSHPVFTPSFRWTAVRGAQFYRLQYTTDPSFEDPNLVNQQDTRNTTYTPLHPLGNDENYYWRVQALSGKSISDWSSEWMFRKQWYTKTVLLTPVNGDQNVAYPLFSWTPVPGASRYQIEVSENNSFSPLTGGFAEKTANTFHVKPDFNWAQHENWHWRVIPLDSTDIQQAKASDVSSFSYRPYAGAPQLIHPPYFYSPQDPNLGYLENLQPHVERTVAWPIFMWHRLLTATVIPNEQVTAYRIQVDDDPLFDTPEWTFDTENLSAVPTEADPFTPVAGTDYYWKVYALDGLGGSEIGPQSQIWRARFDASRGLPLTSTATLLRPAHGAEFVETTPLLEWWPIQDAAAYELQISTDASFGSGDITDTATLPYPAYAPPTRLGYGTYYWRVRGLDDGGSPLGDWSDPWRFQVAATSRWRSSRIIGNSTNRAQIGADPAGDMSDLNYDLRTLYAVQGRYNGGNWFFGFDVYTGTTNMMYVLYLDLDHEDYSGATRDARGYNVITIPGHQPEYALYVEQKGGNFDAYDVRIYPWTGNDWGNPNRLSEIGGDLYTQTITSTLPASVYIELRVPDTQIGMEQETSSAAVSLFTAQDPGSGGHAQDTVPSDPNVDYGTLNSGPETTTLSRFTSVSDRINLAAPPTNATDDPRTYPFLPPTFWHLPVDTPWFGYKIDTALDEKFTTVPWSYGICGLDLVIPIHTYADDLEGDNTYYWRVHAYHTSNRVGGAWSEANSFDRVGYIPQNAQHSIEFATPTLSWDMMEGARYYRVQVDNDPGFGEPDIEATTAQPSFTPIDTLGQGTYYWRVQAKRFPNLINSWTNPQTFTLSLPRPTGLSHSPPGVVGRAPTLCWTPLITPTNNPILTAYRYRLEISDGDPTFSNLYELVNNLEQCCWTPVVGYADRTNYYWRVAMIDGQGRIGDYSAPISFTKQYPVTTLISPTHGSQSGETPTFVWTPVDGAASYRLEVSLYDNFGILYDSVTTNNSRYTPLKDYTAGETYYWRVAIKDKSGHSGPFNDATIILTDTNQAPYKPSDPSPADLATDVPTDQTLSWTGGDPDGDPVTYQVAFGTDNPPSVVATDLTNASYDPGPLAVGTTYYWAITASDDSDETTEGDVWRFTTGGSSIYLPLVLRE